MSYRQFDAAELVHELFQNHTAVMLLIDPVTGRIVAANRAAETFYGFPPGELMRCAIQDINTLPPADVEAERQRALREERNYFLFSHRRADGTVRDVAVRSSPVTLAGEMLLFSIVDDVTAHLAIVRQLRSTNDELTDALARVRRLEGLIRICANCKRICAGPDEWQAVEQYVTEHSEAKFSHGICPGCIASLYPDELG